MSQALYKVELCLDEILRLDGACRPEIQLVVEQARTTVELAKELPQPLAKMVSTVLGVAETDGRLVYERTNVRRCPCCGRSDGYWPVRRSTRYKTRGKPDYDKPRLFCAWGLQRRFLHIQNHLSVGVCETCAPQVLPVLRARLDGVKAEIPEALLGRPSTWKWKQNRECTQCGWSGHEGQMIEERTIMGDGWYPAKCPKCNAGGAFSSAVKLADGFTLVPAADAGAPK